MYTTTFIINAVFLLSGPSWCRWWVLQEQVTASTLRGTDSERNWCCANMTHLVGTHDAPNESITSERFSNSYFGWNVWLHKDSCVDVSSCLLLSLQWINTSCFWRRGRSDPFNSAMVNKLVGFKTIFVEVDHSQHLWWAAWCTPEVYLSAGLEDLSLIETLAEFQQTIYCRHFPKISHQTIKIFITFIQKCVTEFYQQMFFSLWLLENIIVKFKLNHEFIQWRSVRQLNTARPFHYL